MTPIFAADEINKSITEAQWQKLVIECAVQNGFSYFHAYDARRSNAGLPDLILWRPGILAGKSDGKSDEKNGAKSEIIEGTGRVLWIELKTEKGKLTKDRVVINRGRARHIRGQETVIAELRAAGAEVYVFRPHDWPEVQKLLARPDVPKAQKPPPFIIH